MSRLLQRRAIELSDAGHALAERMAALGHRVTQPRLAVLDAAAALPASFTAAELEQWLVARQRSPGTASIFRTLKLLVEAGILERIHGVDECHRYTVSAGHGHRVVCLGCGALSNFEQCALDGLVVSLEQATGYRISQHLLEFFGQCPACQRGGIAV
jgi:Fur family ferric uptake transcriptional regulator